MWQPLCHESEVAKPGDYVRLPYGLAGHLVVSNFDGLIKTWDNVCPHRGMRVLNSSCGNSDHVCAYHGRRVPPGQVRSWPTVVHRGWIWADLSGGTEFPRGDTSLSETVPKHPMRLHGRYDRLVAAPVEVCVENALEAVHVPHVHPGSLGRLGLKSKAEELFADGSSAELFTVSDPARLDKLATLCDPGALMHGGDYFHVFMAPFTCVSSVRGFTFSLQHYFPAGQGKSHFVHRLYASPRTPLYVAQTAFDLNVQVFEEDIAICERVDPTFPRPATVSERRIANYRRQRA
jgi:phenylpropionate dioxygenase-like ring-hydroxylating dioxygenase large terminal subunit